MDAHRGLFPLTRHTREYSRCRTVNIPIVDVLAFMVNQRCHIFLGERDAADTADSLAGTSHSSGSKRKHNPNGKQLATESQRLVSVDHKFNQFSNQLIIET